MFVGSYQKSELSVVMKAKDLCRYVMTVTQKSPKQYRFTFTTRLQNLSMDIIEDIYLANETFVGGPEAKVKAQRRLDLQRHDKGTASGFYFPACSGTKGTFVKTV